MLAAIDDESDAEPVEVAKSVQRTALSTITGNAQSAGIRKDIGLDSESASDGESNGDSPVKPRGRLAARLAGQVPDKAVSIDKATSPSSNEDEGNGNSYTRIKKQLLCGDAKKAHGPFSDSESDVAESKEPALQSETPSVPATSESNIGLRGNSMQSRRSSPGLFVTPGSTTRRCKSPTKAASNDGSDSDLPAEPQANSRFLEPVAKKRAECEAKQAEGNRKLEEKSARQRSFEKELSRDASSGSGLSEDDRAADRKLTQQSRPTRKASKKALEEMNRETQRMSRNMQLAHQAKTKKKITKDSLFARFNFRVSAVSNGGAAQNQSSSTAASSAPVTDAEDAPLQESPPTSPIGPEDVPKAPVEFVGEKQSAPAPVEATPIGSEDNELPTLLEIMSQPVLKVDKGKGKAIEQVEPISASDSKKSKRYNFSQRPIKVHAPKPSLRPSDFSLHSESDLEVLPSRKKKPSKLDVFDRLPPSKVQEGRSLQTLRALAHLNSPEKQNHGKRASMSLADLQRSLQGRARQQAVEERAAKIEDLKSRGIIVQTVEERQKDQAEVEDLLEKARKEGEEIHQKEKRAAKKAKIANGKLDDLPDTSDEDDDYEDEGPDVELSGSEEEHAEIPDVIDENASEDEESLDEDEEEGGIALDNEEPKTKHLVDDEASEDGDDEEEDGQDGEDASEEDEAGGPQIQRSRRNKMVIADDDEDMEEKVDATAQSQIPPVQVPKIPTIYGDLKNMVVPMGMTQAFAATIADTQTQAREYDEEQDSLAFLGPAPEPDAPMFDVDDMVEDSQNGLQFSETNKEIDLHFSQSQIRYDALGDTQGDAEGLVMTTQMSEIPDPTQDVGFVMSSPAPQRFASPPPSTVDRVPLSVVAGNVSPVKKKRGRLQRRTVVEEDMSDTETHSAGTGHETIEKVVSANAFDAMEKARQRAAAAAAKEAFNKKKSDAKGMVEEQAQESEDEFQGIGGPSDDESGGEDDEYVREMIDQGEVDVDEGQLAALFA